MASDLEIQRSQQILYSGPEDFDSWLIEGEKDAWNLSSGGSLIDQGRRNCP